MPKEQIQAIKKKIENPCITLIEKVMDGIQDLKLDSEIKDTAVLKVNEISRRPDFDYDMGEEDYKKGKERPKVLEARFEVKDIKKV